MDNPILKIRNLNVEFPLFGGILQREVSHVHAVKNLNLDISEGRTIGIVGESGSGKSTLGKAILNVLKLTAPDVRVTGQILLRKNNSYIDLLSLNKNEILKYRPMLQMIFQDPFSSLNPRMIVKDIIKEPLDIHTNLSEEEKKNKIDWLLEKVGLSAEQSSRYPHEFSGGQRQRIGIARALATDPEILILDEATSALDNEAERAIQSTLSDLQKGRTTLVIAHRLSTVQSADQILVLEQGQLIEQGSHQALMEKNGIYAHMYEAGLND